MCFESEWTAASLPVQFSFPCEHKSNKVLLRREHLNMLDTPPADRKLRHKSMASFEPGLCAKGDDADDGAEPRGPGDPRRVQIRPVRVCTPEKIKELSTWEPLCPVNHFGHICQRCHPSTLTC